MERDEPNAAMAALFSRKRRERMRYDHVDAGDLGSVFSQILNLKKYE
jgi:hypothetical protein